MIPGEFGPVQVALVGVAGVVGVWLVASVLTGWVQRLVVRMAFRHLVVAGLTAVGGVLVERYGFAGLIEKLADVLIGGMG